MQTHDKKSLRTRETPYGACVVHVRVMTACDMVRQLHAHLFSLPRRSFDASCKHSPEVGAHDHDALRVLADAKKNDALFTADQSRPAQSSALCS
eukprot:300132-Amphidinium_carterae.2